MAKEATLQIKMDSDLKEQVELSYEKMGTSFAEAVRIFAKQSVEEKAMPITMQPSARCLPLTSYEPKVRHRIK